MAIAKLTIEKYQYPTNTQNAIALKAKIDELIDFNNTFQAAPAVLSGAGAVDPTRFTTLFTSTGAGNALTLANGTYAGQRVRVFHTVKGSSGTGVITPTTFNHTSVTLTNVNASVEFTWTGTTWTLTRLIDATVTG